MSTISKLVVRLLIGVVVATQLLGTAALATERQTADRQEQPPALRTPSAPDEVVLTQLEPEERPAREVGAADDLLSPSDPTSGGWDAADDFKAGPGCSIQCIVSGVGYARGVGARLVVETDTPAQIWIGVWNDDGYNRWVDSGPGDVTSFGFHFDDLAPGTFYSAMAVAEDGEGYASHAYGHFTTLERHVEIEIGNATIHEDAFADNRFTKYVWVEGQFLDAYTVAGLQLQGSTLDWGGNTISETSTGRYLDLAVQLVEGNEDNNNDVCEVYYPPEPGFDGSGCHEAAYAYLHSGDNDLDERPADATSWTEHQLERTLFLPGGDGLPPGYGLPLVFTVDVTLNVFYS